MSQLVNFPEPQNDVFRGLVLSETQRYSVYCDTKQQIFTFKKLETQKVCLKNESERFQINFLLINKSTNRCSFIYQWYMNLVVDMQVWKSDYIS